MSASRDPVTYTQPSFVSKENSLDFSRPASPEIDVKFMANESNVNADGTDLKLNILYYTELTLSNYWFYDPVM